MEANKLRFLIVLPFPSVKGNRNVFQLYTKCTVQNLWGKFSTLTRKDDRAKRSRKKSKRNQEIVMAGKSNKITDIIENWVVGLYFILVLISSTHTHTHMQTDLMLYHQQWCLEITRNSQSFLFLSSIIELMSLLFHSWNKICMNTGTERNCKHTVTNGHPLV
jgi:hypothetical protein